MAHDLIPPPSPAGKPEPGSSRGAFSESELLRTDAEHEAARAAGEPIAPAEESPYRSRFGFILGALVGLGVAAMVIVALVATSGETIREPQWSAWKPADEDPDIRAVEIARHVGSQYRLDDGDQLVDVYAQRLEIGGDPLSVVIRSAGKGEGADIIDIPGNSLLFVLKGLGPRGSIDVGEPSEARLRLVQREAYELALYAFKYVDDVDNVVAFLPPPPPAAGSEEDGSAGPTTAAAAQGEPLPAMLFLPGDLQASLERPLADTFPGQPPRPSTLTKSEADTFASLAQIHAFNASVVPDQTGAGFLVLDRMSQSAQAQESLRSTLKA
jgi:hypothetical protein